MNGSNKIKHLEKEFPKYLPPPSPSKLQVMAFSHSTDKSSLSTTEAFPAHGKEKLMFLVLLLPQTCNWSGNESLKVQVSRPSHFHEPQSGLRELQWDPSWNTKAILLSQWNSRKVMERNSNLTLMKTQVSLGHASQCPQKVHRRSRSNFPTKVIYVLILVDVILGRKAGREKGWLGTRAISFKKDCIPPIT